MKKMLIINPPDFTKYFYEQNIFCKDGLYVINTLLKNSYPNILTKTIDFDYLNLGIFDVFDELKDYNPDYVYLNLNSYNYFSNSYLCVGIKRYCPYTKIIVGLNLSEKIKKELDEKVKECIDYYLDYDLSSLKIDIDLISKIKLFEKHKYYKNIYFYNKTKEEIIDEINLNLENDVTRFIFRGCNDFYYEDLIFILNKTKKYFKFILENDILDVYQINSLHKKFHMNGIILDLNNNIFAAQKAKQLKIFSFSKINLDETNKELYNCLKQYNLLFLDITSNSLVSCENFKDFRNKELKTIYMGKDYFIDNLRYWVMNPMKMRQFHKYKDFLWKETKYLK